MESSFAHVIGSKLLVVVMLNNGRVRCHYQCIYHHHHRHRHRHGPGWCSEQKFFCFSMCVGRSLFHLPLRVAASGLHWDSALLNPLTAIELMFNPGESRVFVPHLFHPTMLQLSCFCSTPALRDVGLSNQRMQSFRRRHRCRHATDDDDMHLLDTPPVDCLILIR